MISVLYFAQLCMKCSLGISNFLQETSSLSDSIIFLYFFALITEEGFLISPCYSLELCIQIGISFHFSFAFLFSYLLFSAICKASSDSHFAFFAFLFLGDGHDPCFQYNAMNLHPHFIGHSFRSNPLNLFVTFTEKIVRDLI